MRRFLLFGTAVVLTGAIIGCASTQISASGTRGDAVYVARIGNVDKDWALPISMDDGTVVEIPGEVTMKLNEQIRRRVSESLGVEARFAPEDAYADPFNFGVRSVDMRIIARNAPVDYVVRISLADGPAISERGNAFAATSGTLLLTLNAPPTRGANWLLEQARGEIGEYYAEVANRDAAISHILEQWASEEAADVVDALFAKVEFVD